MAQTTLSGAIAPGHEGLRALIAALEQTWPQHLPFVSRHLSARSAEELRFLDEVASRIVTLAGDALPAYLRNYKAVCASYIKAEMAYRRMTRYEHATFDEVVRALYDDGAAMHDYMIGLLVSLVFWWQNGAPLMHFRDVFLPMFRGPFRMLEIGPGHGIWTAFTLQQSGCRGVAGMDISAKSLELTRACLERFGLAAGFEALRGDICRPPAIKGTFEGAVLSQVLEIVSDPAAALRHLHGMLKPDGLLYVNAPVDFAAPDHIRRWQSSAEIDALAAEAGFETVRSASFLPTTLAKTEKTGYSYVAILKRN